MIQVKTGILPQTFADSSFENVNDTDEHTSLEIDVRYLHEKSIEVICAETGNVEPLWLWVELASDTSLIDFNVGTHYLWAAISGGGGEVSPVSPEIIVRTGVGSTGQLVLLSWTMHSTYARLVVHCPAYTTGAWAVQARFSGKA